MIQVCNVLYDHESQEADIELESNGVRILCYAHPVKSTNQINELINNALFAFQPTDIQIEESSVPKAIKTNHGYYSYFLIGKAISDSQIQIHDFIIHIGYLPGDIVIGDYVSCRCLRLDM